MDGLLLGLVMWAWLSAGSLLGPIVPQAWAALCPLLPSDQDRVAFNFSPLHGEVVTDFPVQELHAGWYNDYQVLGAPLRLDNLAHVQTLFAGGSPTLNPTQDAALRAAVQANPGSLWLAGNEPDRKGIQDNLRPADYAQYYHTVYTLIKEVDPTARVAIAGVVQPTPIRLRYLDQVLAAYQARYGRAMPIDVWNIHAFILREELNSWGADIPPGLEEYAHEGRLYQVSDNGRLDIFQEYVINFRAWMAARGYRDTPLIISEFGVLMPIEYGFSDATVAQFLTDSFTFLATATDANTGYPADGNRLVQAWSWFSLNERPYDLSTGVGFNGHLYDVVGFRGWRATGQSFINFAAPLVDAHADLAVAAVAVVGSATGVFVPHAAMAVTVTVMVVNGGSRPSGAVTVELWRDGLPGEGGTLVATQPLSSVPSHCRTPSAVTFSLAAADLPVGLTPLWGRVVSADAGPERRAENNRAAGSVVRLAPGQSVQTLRLPFVQR
jgi:hypothetical protein